MECFGRGSNAKKTATLSETNIGNWWLEDDPFLLVQKAYFQGLWLLLSGSLKEEWEVCHEWLVRIVMSTSKRCRNWLLGVEHLPATFPKRKIPGHQESILKLITLGLWVICFLLLTFNAKKRPENFGFHSLVASQVILHSGEGLDFEKESQFYGIPTGKFENFGGILAALRILSKIAILRTPKHHALQVQNPFIGGSNDS